MGIREFWTVFLQSSLLIQTVFGVLGVMSFLSWSVIFFKWRQIAVRHRQVLSHISILGAARNWREALQGIILTPDSPSYRVAKEGAAERGRIARMGLPKADEARVALESMRHAMASETQAQVDELGTGIPLLATCSTAGPLLGLFGTVTGIMDSFHGFSEVRTMSLSAVGPGLAEALATTIVGLIVAIPATLAHNYLLSRLGRLESDLRRFSESFLNAMKKDFTAAAKQAPRTP